MMPKERLTKSKGRIKKYGEVFTPEWVVKMMVDELEKSNGPLPIEATVLEPSCGEEVCAEYCESCGQRLDWRYVK